MDQEIYNKTGQRMFDYSKTEAYQNGYKTAVEGSEIPDNLLRHYVKDFQKGYRDGLMAHSRYADRATSVSRCMICDNEVVKASDPNTGSFYPVWGHSYNAATEHFDGPYVCVLFAICPNCVNKPTENSSVSRAN